MTVKSILLGSAAGLVAFTGARAADPQAALRGIGTAIVLGLLIATVSKITKLPTAHTTSILSPNERAVPMPSRAFFAGLLLAGFFAITLWLAGYARAQQPEPIDWTGWYAGGHLGWLHIDGGSTLPSGIFGGLTGDPVRIDRGSGAATGWGLGGQIGYWHPVEDQNWLWGADLSATWLNSDPMDLSEEAHIFNVTSDVGWLMLGQARLGFDQGRWLGYVQGGYAGAQVDLNVMREFVPVLSKSAWYHGITLGAGGAHMLRPNLSIGLDYNWIKLWGDGLVDVDRQIDNPDFPDPSDDPFLNARIRNSEFDHDIHMIKASLNWHF